MHGGGRSIPAAASTLAATYLLAGVALPTLMPLIALLAAVGACALALRRRSHPRLRAVIAAVALWLAVGFAGAWLGQDHALAGLGWVVAVLFLLPLPIIPWMYAQSFPEPRPKPPEAGL